MRREEYYRHRLVRQRSRTMAGPNVDQERGTKDPRPNATVDCGWGRLIFAHTFRDNRKLADVLLEELPGKRISLQ